MWHESHLYGLSPSWITETSLSNWFLYMKLLVQISHSNSFLVLSCAAEMWFKNFTTNFATYWFGISMSWYSIFKYDFRISLIDNDYTGIFYQQIFLDLIQVFSFLCGHMCMIFEHLFWGKTIQANLNGFFPSWTVVMCLSKFPFPENVKPQISQLIKVLYSWIDAMCFFQFSFEAKSPLQISHWNDFFSSWNDVFSCHHDLTQNVFHTDDYLKTHLHTCKKYKFFFLNEMLYYMSSHIRH